MTVSASSPSVHSAVASAAGKVVAELDSGDGVVGLHQLEPGSCLHGARQDGVHEDVSGDRRAGRLSGEGDLRQQRAGCAVADENQVLARRVDVQLLGDASHEVRRVGRFVVVEHLGHGDAHPEGAESVRRRSPDAGRRQW